VFGDVVDEEMRLNASGEIVRQEWLRSAWLRCNVEPDAFVVMPNHIHAVVLISDEGRGTARRAPTVERFGKPVPGSIPTVIRAFKSAVTKRVNEMRGTPGAAVWQRNYYEHVIRSEEEFNKIRRYIADNPLQWAWDRENPEAATAGEGQLRTAPGDHIERIFGGMRP
jgi:REP element-mobilizing transposase RayT